MKPIAKMDNDGKQSGKSTLSPSIVIFAALTMLAVTVYSFPVVAEELKVGEAYTFAVVFGNGNEVYKTNAPIFFWINIGWQVLGFLMLLILPIGMLWETFIRKKRR